MLDDLYEYGYPVGMTAGLLPIYAQLVLIFRDNIAPSGGNNDAVTPPNRAYAALAIPAKLRIETI